MKTPGLAHRVVTMARLWIASLLPAGPARRREPTPAQPSGPTAIMRAALALVRAVLVGASLAAPAAQSAPGPVGSGMVRPELVMDHEFGCDFFWVTCADHN